MPRLSRRQWAGVVAGAVALAVGAYAVGLAGVWGPAPAHGETGTGQHPEPEAAAGMTVNVIRARRDPLFRVEVRQLAVVEAEAQVGLRARVSGVVKQVTKDIGDPVKAGELLIEIDVPDLVEELAQKEAVVRQRQRERDLSRALAENADALVAVARAGVTQREAELAASEATRDYRQKRLARFQTLASRGAVNADIVDEQQRECDAAVAEAAGARAAVQKAKADQAEKESSRKAAAAEVALKEALIQVAEEDRDRARTMLEYARLTAPFDGVVTRRNSDPGAFVHNSTSAHSDALMHVARIDTVTVATRVPDNVAGLVGKETPAWIQIDGIAGPAVPAKVTRLAPLVEDGDRTMRVEVDVPNSSHKLLPGMSGTMRLELDRLTDAYLLPSGAVFSRGGKPYVLLVEDGKTRLAPVAVGADDGRLAKVSLLGKDGTRRELTGEEEVVLSRQLEVGEGQTVRTVAQDW